MHSRIVKVVTRHIHRLVVAAASAKTRRVIVLPLDGATELILRAQVVDLLDVGHAVVLVVVKTGADAVLKPVGTAHAGKSIDNQHITLARCGLTKAQGLTGETAAAVVDGDDAVTVHLVIVNAHAILRALDGSDFLETAFQSHTFTDDVTRRVGIVTQIVVGGIPREQVLTLTRLADGKVVDGQRLYDVTAVVALGDKLEHALVDGAAHVKAEHRVQAIFHVGKVLVREQLHQHGGHLGHASFIVALVPHAATCPVGFPLGTHVLDNLGREQVGKTARELTRSAVGILAKLLSVGAGAIDQQGSHDLIVGSRASIGMQAERQVNRHPQATTVGQHVAAASQVVDPLAAAAVVVGVVIDAVRGGIDAVREAGPLQVVTRAQVEPGMVTATDVAIVHTRLAEVFLVLLLGGDAAIFLGRQSHAAHNIAVSAAHLDGVGRDDGILVLAQVGYLNHSLIHALGQRECAHIYPHTTSHRLVNAELALSGLAIDGVSHITGAVGQRFIRDIDGIIATVGHIHIPRGCRDFLLVLLGLYHAVSALGEGILKVLILVAQVGEACSLSILPLLLAIVLTVAILGQFTRVIIDHSAIVVGVTLTRVPHIGTRILQHRDEEGQHIAVGVHVLDGLHEACALPLPAVKQGLEIPAVAGPHGDDVAVQAMLVVTVGVQLADEGLV